MKQRGGEATIPYAGTDNLEVMADAHNYNAFLLDLVADTCAEAERLLRLGGKLIACAPVLSSLFNPMQSCDGTLNLLTTRARERFAFPLSQVLDGFLSSLFGKNTSVVARRPLASGDTQ